MPGRRRRRTVSDCSDFVCMLRQQAHVHVLHCIEFSLSHGASNSDQEESELALQKALKKGKGKGRNKAPADPEKVNGKGRGKGKGKKRKAEPKTAAAPKARKTKALAGPQDEPMCEAASGEDDENMEQHEEEKKEGVQEEKEEGIHEEKEEGIQEEKEEGIQEEKEEGIQEEEEEGIQEEEEEGIQEEKEEGIQEKEEEGPRNYDPNQAAVQPKVTRKPRAAAKVKAKAKVATKPKAKAKATTKDKGTPDQHASDEVETSEAWCACYAAAWIDLAVHALKLVWLWQAVEPKKAKGKDEKKEAMHRKRQEKVQEGLKDLKEAEISDLLVPIRDFKAM